MSLKHLLATLHARPGAVNIPHDEFEQLLTDVQIGRNTAKAQEEFYESMEKVVNELRAHTNEIQPFLKPVTKKDAHDYDTVIRNPMDLGTVSRNVKQKTYRTKKAFARDLGLIWENALRYNSVEGHPIRAQAVFCRKLALHLLDVVPDRADVMDGVSRSGTILKPGAQTVSHQDVAGSRADADGDVIMIESSVGLLEERRSSGERSLRPGYHPFKSILGDMPAIVRAPTSMQPLHLLLQPEPTQHEPRKQPAMRGRQRTGHAAPSWYPMNLAPANNTSTGGSDAEIKAAGDDAVTTAWWACCNDIGTLGQVLPIGTAGTIGNDTMTAPRRKRKRQVFDEHGTELDRGPTISLPKIIHGNIGTLAKVRKRFVRLTNRLCDPDAEEQGYGSAGSEEEDRNVRSTTSRKRHDGPPVIDHAEAFGGLRRATGAMIAHTGFEGCSTSSLDLCSQLVESFVENFGKTVVSLRDRDGAAANISSSLQHAMLANGMMQTSELDQYLREDLVRYGVRLDEAAKKLKQAFIDVNVDVEEQDIDDSEFIFGGLPGMDDMAEFLGMEMPAVPKRLLVGKKRAMDAAATASSQPTAIDPYEAPPPFAPFVSADVPHQIGLLQDFFQSKLDEQGTLLIDEEFENAVPALGAFGQIVQRSAASVKKKTADGAVKGVKRGGTAARGRGNNPVRGGKTGRGGKQVGAIDAGDVEIDGDASMDVQD